MDLRLLTSFATVVTTGSVSAAADELHITQPALSRQLQQLERELDLALFRRDRRRLVLTAAGQSFLVAAQGVLSEAAAAENLASMLAAGRVERIRAMAPTTTLTDVFAPFLATLDEDDPLITVEEATYADAIHALQSRADLAVVTAPPPRALGSRRVARLPVWAYVSASHPLAGRASVTVAELAEDRIITLGSNARPRQLLEEALIEEGVSAREVVECSNPQVAQALAAAGRGVALVSDDPRFDLRQLLVETGGGALTLTLYAAWNRDHHAAATLERLADRLVDFCEARYGVAETGRDARSRGPVA